MKTLMVMLFSGVLSLGGVYFVQDSEAQEANKQTRSADGLVSQIDWVGSKLVVDVGGDEMTFVVEDDVKVQRGTDELSVNDLDQSDAITVYYYDNGAAGLKVVRITDNSPL